MSINKHNATALVFSRLEYIMMIPKFSTFCLEAIIRCYYTYKYNTLQAELNIVKNHLIIENNIILIFAFNVFSTEQ